MVEICDLSLYSIFIVIYIYLSLQSASAITLQFAPQNIQRMALIYFWCYIEARITKTQQYPFTNSLLLHDVQTESNPKESYTSLTAVRVYFATCTKPYFVSVTSLDFRITIASFLTNKLRLHRICLRKTSKPKILDYKALGCEMG